VKNAKPEAMQISIHSNVLHVQMVNTKSMMINITVTTVRQVSIPMNHSHIVIRVKLGLMQHQLKMGAINA
jgi:hypothetical protein